MAKFVLSAFADEAGSSIEEQIAALKANGIDFIEPRNIGGKGILTLTDEELLEKFLMGALLHDFAVVQHQNHIRIHDGA